MGRTRLVILTVALVLGVAAGCSPSADREAGPLRSDLTFTLAGADLGTQTFGPDLADPTGHWVFDPRTARTRIHVSGSSGPWRTGVDFVVPLDRDGTYVADSSHGGIDRAFVVSLANHVDGRRIGLVATDATLDLRLDGSDPAWLVGTFSGRFAVGRRSTGRDVLAQSEEERAFADLREGRFRVRYEDTLHGRGRPWAAPAPSP